MLKINETNFWTATRAFWEPVAHFGYKPDYESQSGSKYRYTESGVYRRSNRWAQVDACWWPINPSAGIRTGQNPANPDSILTFDQHGTPIEVTAFAAWDSFEWQTKLRAAVKDRLLKQIDTLPRGGRLRNLIRSL